MNDPFARLGTAMVRLRWVVLAFWLILLPFAGALGASKAASVLKGGGFVVDGSDSDRATEILAREFNASNDDNALVVFRSPTLTVDDPVFRSEVTAAGQRLASVEGIRAVIDFYGTGNPGFVSPDRKTTYLVAVIDSSGSEPEKLVPALREQLTDVSLEHYVTGSPAIGYDLETASEHDLRRAEFFTIPIIVVLLLIVFRTIVSAALPLILGACSVVPAIALLYVLGLRSDVSIFALNVASMLGLGLGIDFSLIVVNRFREELAHGRDPRSAVVVTMATAGRSITYSGVTVLLGMFVLTLMLDLMLVRSMSLAVMLVAFTALAAGLTLLPALLGILGRRIEWLPVWPRRKVQERGNEGFWYRFSHAIMRRPWVWLAVSVLLLAALAFPMRDIDVLGATPGVLPTTSEARQGNEALNEGFGATRLNPIQVVIQTGEQNGVWKPEFLEALATLTSEIKADPHVQDVSSLITLVPDLPADQARSLTPDVFTQDPARAAGAAQYVNLGGRNDIALVTIVSKHGQFDDQSEDLVTDLRESIVPGVRQMRVYDVTVGGNTASFLDLRDSLYSRFPLLIAVVMLLIYIMLLMFFQSVFLPLKAILMNLASVAATYGVLVLIFQHGWGASLIGLDPLGKLNVTTPVILFVILICLSTDYEVFMLSRVKEYYHETHNNEEAVAAGLQSTARVITAAGLILIGTFGSFGLADVVVIKEIGIGLAIGVLLDSTIVRAIMVPATMRLLGDVNWWMPTWLKKIVPELREGPAPELAPAPVLAPAPGFVHPTGQPPVLPPLAIQPSPAMPALSSPHSAVAQPLPVPTQPRPRTVMIGQLRPTGAPVGADQIVLPKLRPLRIGRNSEAELWLFDKRISRNHARIDYDAASDSFIVTDLGSVNGVYVNQRRITGPTALRHGDHLEIGTTGAITFAFETRAESRQAPVSAPAPA